jgi:hypothetical protein
VDFPTTACSKRRNNGTPESANLNAGTPECRNTGILFSLLKENLKKYFKSIRIFLFKIKAFKHE